MSKYIKRTAVAEEVTGGDKFCRAKEFTEFIEILENKVSCEISKFKIEVLKIREKNTNNSFRIRKK